MQARLRLGTVVPMGSSKPPVAPPPLVSPFSRRTLLRGAALLPVAAAASRCAPDLHATDPAFDALPATRHGQLLLGVLPHGANAVVQACNHLDFSWLRPGDSVFLKLASNSAKPHPATTAPDAVRGMVQALKDRGAGRVVVGDQAGIQWVRYRAQGQLTGRSSMDVLRENGLLAAIEAAGAEVHTFDSEPFDAGYFAATPPRISHWRNDIFLPNIINNVDHIIYMPRISAHAITGYTMALKIVVGFMRDDTRLEFHQKGASLYEKYAQISYVPQVRSKLRMVFSYASRLLLDIGPDNGTEVPLPQAIMVAGTHPADHDALTSAMLLAYDDLTPSPIDVVEPYPLQSNYWNTTLVQEWGDAAMRAYERFVPAAYWLGVAHDPAVRHAYVLDGERPHTITVRQLGGALPPPVMQALAQRDGGLFSFERV